MAAGVERSAAIGLSGGVLMFVVSSLLAAAVWLPGGDSPAAGPATQDRGVKFRTAPARRGDLTVTVLTTGVLQPEEVVDVSPQVAGAVQKLGADPGDPTKTIDWNSQVEAGTVLLQIDPKLYQAAADLARAKANKARAAALVAEARLAGSEREWQRAQKLGPAIARAELEALRTKFEVARAEVELARADLEVARAELTSAEANLGHCTVRSPAKGVVVDRRVNVGQTVASSLTAPSLFLIAKDLRRLQVWASVFEGDVGQIKAGQKATFTVDAYPDQVFQAVVQQVRLNASMTQNVVTYTVVLNTDNAGLKLLPYMTAEVRVAADTKKKNALLVPVAALRWWPEVTQVVPYARARFLTMKPAAPHQTAGYVWVEEKGFVSPVSVRRGFVNSNEVELIGGDVAAGMRVVVGSEPKSADGRSKDK
jgi:HlyD family secretion protein